MPINSTAGDSASTAYQASRWPRRLASCLQKMAIPANPTRPSTRKTENETL